MAHALQSVAPVRCYLGTVIAIAMLAAVAGAGCSTMIGKDCVSTSSNEWDLQEPTTPSLTLKIEDCRIDGGACNALCEMVLADNDVDESNITSCSVRFDGSTIHVSIDYDSPDDTNGNCAIPVDADANGTSGGD
jgi:hypothetical protein